MSRYFIAKKRIPIYCYTVIDGNVNTNLEQLTKEYKGIQLCDAKYWTGNPERTTIFDVYSLDDEFYTSVEGRFVKLYSPKYKRQEEVMKNKVETF